MNRLLLQALSCICFAAPLGVLLLLEGPQILNSLPTLFVALCCGVGLAAGIASASAGSSTAEEQRETLVPQQLQCRFKQDLGLNYNEDALVRDHVTEFKYLGLLLFLFRLTVNIKALYLNVVAVCTVELPETVGSVARVLEAGIFLEHLCKLPIELLSVLLAGSPCPCISTVKTLAGFSSMRFLRFLNKREILGALRKVLGDRSLLQGCSLLILGVLYSLLLAAFGLAVLLSKLQRLDFQQPRDADIVQEMREGASFLTWRTRETARDLSCLVLFLSSIPGIELAYVGFIFLKKSDLQS
ncbi:unnamed protein product [Durusdinium trenchii]|uniref:Uncharacterized protein n=1 Tax=Durusdinium trenchii TaxID=1381693 RepID=A0ABP0NY22_9DINO